MNFQFLSYFSLECLCLYLSYASNLQGWILTPPSNLPFEKGPALQSSYIKRPLLAQYLKTNPYLTFFYLDLCIMPSTLGKQTCPRNHANKLAEKCVAKYITAKSCKAAVGIWKSSPPTTWKKQQGFWAPVMTRETWSWQEVFHMNLISFHKELIKRNSLSSFKNSRMLSTRLPLSLIITE